jgi:DNA topoisomerase VI subunit B
MQNITITAEVKRRIEQAIRETETLLNNELKYSVEFQKQDSIERYTQHIARLKNMIL